MATSSSAYEKLISAGTKIVAVGRNYAAHAKELGNAVPKEPVLFLKPTTSYLENGGVIEVPYPLESLDHEVELAVIINQRGRDIPERLAMNYVGGYALALDMTAREIQATAKSKGLPWTVAKGQDTFTPISSVLPCSKMTDPHDIELWLKVDGEIRQKGSTKDMIFKIPYLISHISSIMTLVEGDVILTGDFNRTTQAVGSSFFGRNELKNDGGIISETSDLEDDLKKVTDRLKEKESLENDLMKEKDRTGNDVKKLIDRLEEIQKEKEFLENTRKNILKEIENDLNEAKEMIDLIVEKCQKALRSLEESNKPREEKKAFRC